MRSLSSLLPAVVLMALGLLVALVGPGLLGLDPASRLDGVLTGAGGALVGVGGVQMGLALMRLAAPLAR